MIISRLKKYNLFIFDSDGCLVEEGHPLPGALELINKLKEMEKSIVLFTNNSTAHPNTVRKKYLEMGFEFTEVVNSGMLAANYCKSQGITSVYVVGEIGLEETLNNFGVKISSDENCEAVIVGMDRTLTYEKLAIATRAIRKGSRFIATNPDPSFPTPRGLEPGAGSMIEAIKVATDEIPEIILGKPNPIGYKLILDQFKIESNEAVMFGDRFETDILGARKSGINAVLIGTGISASRSKDEELNKLSENETYINNLTQILDFLNEE